VRVYHFINSQFGEEAIRRQRVKISRINALNDPFEHLQYQTENHVARFLLRERRNRMNRLWGILCFSASYANPVQWAHYADVHRGLCLGFDVSDEGLIKIEYVKHRASFDEFQSAMKLGELSFLRHMLSKKYDHWAYEEEHRVLVSLGREVKQDWMCFASFCADLQLREVIFGARFDGDRRAIRKWLKDSSPDVATFSVTPSTSEFKMVRAT
jgi:hypothetical protein